MYNKIEFGDCRETMRRWKEQGIKAQTCVTSPPYFGLRDYGHEGQIGLEQTPEEYITAMVEVFRCVWDVLEDDGTLWLNIGDSYASYRHGKATPDTTLGNSTGTLVPKGSARNQMASSFQGSEVKHKDLIGIPWMLAFALRADGWYLRQEIIWAKPNPMPESVKDRCTKSHEQIFLLVKSPKYYCDMGAIAEPATTGDCGSSFTRGKTGSKKQTAVGQGERVDDGIRNKRSVWTVSTKPYSGAHFAVFPADLIEPCILAGAPAGGVVLDPFMGSGTTAQVAQNLGRQYLGCELNPEYAALQHERTKQFSLAI